MERRKQLIQVAGATALVFILGFGAGYVSKQQTFTPITGMSPVPCLTLAVIPADVLPQPQDVTINVLNGSKRMGIAGIAAEVFTARGFTLNTIGNFDDYEVQTSAEIHYGTKGQKAAQLAQAFIRDAVMIKDERTDDSVDVVLGQAFEDVLTNDAAHAELLRPSASPSGPDC